MHVIWLDVIAPLTLHAFKIQTIKNANFCHLKGTKNMVGFRKIKTFCKTLKIAVII
jgi:hypothetical protein